MNTQESAQTAADSKYIKEVEAILRLELCDCDRMMALHCRTFNQSVWQAVQKIRQRHTPPITPQEHN